MSAANAPQLSRSSSSTVAGPDMLRELLTRGGLDPNYQTVDGVTLTVAPSAVVALLRLKASGPRKPENLITATQIAEPLKDFARNPRSTKGRRGVPS